MNISEGDNISISHYAKTHASRTTVVKLADGILQIKQTRELNELSFDDGDPVVAGFETSLGIYICECDIVNIDSIKEIITLKVNNIVAATDKRVSERFPVSLCADIMTEKLRKRTNAFIKNISSNGMAIFSKTELDHDTEVEIDMYIDKKIISLKAEVVWLMQVPYGFEYGLKNVYFDYNSRNSLKVYLDYLKEEYEEGAKDLKA